MMEEKIVKSEAEWRAQLSLQQYDVLREAGTERAGSGALLHTKAAGSYVCAGCGNALFDASAKYDSHCGWPSFTEPEFRDRVTLHEDRSQGMLRTEVRCARCDSHLGHVFPDGSGPTGERYCMNSLSLAFIPKA